MYERYLADPSSVDEEWAAFFAQDRNDGQASEPQRDAGSAQRSAVRQDSAPNSTSVTPRPASQAADGTANSDSPAPPAPPNAADAQARSSERQRDQQARNQQAQAAPAQSAPAQDGQQATSDDTEKRPAGDVDYQPMRGAEARTASNMDESLSVPTATSVRSVPVKLIFDNRVVINNHLARARGGKVSFTHIIGYAVVKAISEMPEMNAGFAEVEGKPHRTEPDDVNFGLAIDVQKSDGRRQLMVPSIKAAETLGFAEFWQVYEGLVRKARDGKLEISDLTGTTVSLTNPGGIGTNHSVPRLVAGQGL